MDKYYHRLIKSIAPVGKKGFYFDKIGIHQIEGKYYFAKFMSYFIQWLLKKMEEGKEQNYFEMIPKDLQQELEGCFQGVLSKRIIETLPELIVKDCRYGEGYLSIVEEGVTYAVNNGYEDEYKNEQGISDNGKVTGWMRL